MSKNLRLVAASLAAGLLLTGAQAHAATVNVFKSNPFVVDYRADVGEANNLNITLNGRMTDSGAWISVGRGCMTLTTDEITCGLTAYDVHLRDGDDRADVSGNHSEIWAGSGDDTVTTFASPNAFVYGESGDDDITADGTGGQLADGGSGEAVWTP